MFRDLRPYLITLVSVFTALTLAALLYSKQHPQSHWIMTAALPAFLIEAVFYLGSIFHETRLQFALLESRRLQAALLWISAALPYLVFAALAHTLDVHALTLIALLSGLLAWWFVVFPRRVTYDIGFVIIAAAPVALRVFPRLYLSPDPRLRVDVLGHLAWIHTGICALLVLREWDPGAFGPWPTLDEWRAGLTWYAVFIAPIAAVAFAIHDVRFVSPPWEWWKTAGIGIGTFFGILWVVALSEELFFRGLIERALLNVQSSATAAILLSAIGFGSVHLWFHNFPNWQRSITAAILGIACGVAYWKSNSVRASMVTHALVVTTWRLFFR